MGMYDKSDVRLYTDIDPHENLAKLAENTAEDLATVIINTTLNRLIAVRDGGLFELRGPMDYQGWFWRSVDFFTPGGVTIADGDGRVAVCENNKWDYPERSLTEDEQAEFLQLVWNAYVASSQGGELGEIGRATDAALKKASDYIASLDVEDDR